MLSIDNSKVIAVQVNIVCACYNVLVYIANETLGEAYIKIFLALNLRSGSSQFQHTLVIKVHSLSWKCCTHIGIKVQNNAAL